MDAESCQESPSEISDKSGKNVNFAKAPSTGFEPGTFCLKFWNSAKWHATCYWNPKTFQWSSLRGSDKGHPYTQVGKSWLDSSLGELSQAAN